MSGSQLAMLILRLFAATALLLALILALTDAARPGQRLGLVAGAGVLIALSIRLPRRYRDEF
jgi:hypothetical protein